MNRYVLRFSKKGNMKYISHLDLHRLFKRSLKKAGIDVDYSKGFNPHEIINVVQPLSLGFESESEYFEMETPMTLDMSSAMNELNAFLPRGIEFTDIRKIPHEKKNLSAYSQSASYRVVIEGLAVSKDQGEAFLSQEKIMILKRDKKTKQMVEKDAKALVFSFNAETEDGNTFIDCLLRCATNESLNPLQLTESFVRFCGKDPAAFKIGVNRLDIFGTRGGITAPLIDLYEDNL